ncbi:hypothetical protein FACS1894109_02110 [Spirochaetia bacterium]|nr:hypothetical protein FACS1894109_02110 [Spirochaetia bacterium]
MIEKWYQKALRYGQTNLTEIDPEVCDLNFWREFWQKTGTQAIIVNAGGIVAYYPSKFKTHYRAARLGDRDLFGEFVTEGRRAGLVILARMDINRATEDVYREHPDWFARKKDGSPFITQGRYQSCLNSAYYKEYIPEILQEIIEKYHPEGFTDNSWTGINRKSICYCENCKREFRKHNGTDLPEEADYNDPVYRKWILWSYQNRIDNWDLFNQVSAKYGGEDCLWLGMVNASPVGNHASFCDLREVAKRSKIIMVDHQGREGYGFEQNSLNGTLLHQLVGWDKIIPESMAAYARGPLTFRRGAAVPLEAQLWMLEGFAGGITPWWHIVGGNQEDRRIYENEVPVMQWHQKHEQYLYNRTPIANVGVLWSQRNVEFYGAAQPYDVVGLAWRGINMALTRAGIPYLPVNVEDIAEQTRDMDLLILTELAIITPEQVQAIRAFAKRGGNILAIGHIGVMDSDGTVRSSSVLEDLLGVHFRSVEIANTDKDAGWDKPVLHNYVRIEKKQSPVFAGFDNTDTLPLGGTVKNIAALPGASVLGTLIPAFPIYPPEFSWTDVTKTDIPVLTEYTHEGKGKTIYAAWDLDAAYGRAAIPDHGDLLGNIVKYLLGNKWIVRVECDAYIDFKFYCQGNRVIIHLININHSGFEHGYAEKNLPVGPVRITLRLPGFSPAKVSATEDGAVPRLSFTDGACSLELERLGVHQMLIVE